MADKYYRLVCFVTNICCQPLRKLFIKLAEADTTNKFTDLQSYLRLRQPRIDRLNLRDDQYFLLLPNSGTPDETTWDVTLLVLLIDKLFQIQPLIKCLLEEMRTIRNILQHVSSTDILSDAKFDEYWHRLESATVALAKEVAGAIYETDIKRQISEGKITNMPHLGDTLRIFYEENSRQLTHKIASLETTIDELHAKLDTIAANSNETSSLLGNVTVTKTGPMGEKVKRFKTVDEILCRLIKRLCATRKTELPENFTPPAEIADVRSKLRESHHVIIAGSGNSLNLATALFAINDFEYNHNRCVEMTDASEWRHIDPEDVDLVLCRDPFGKPLYDAEKASSMVDIFDSIHHAVRPRDGSKHLDFIIVTEVDCLTELKATRDHDLLEEVVLLSTSENHPVDLTAASYKSSEQSGYKVDFTRYMTQTILDNYSLYTANIDPSKLKQAREFLSKHRMVAITGPPNSGKTSAVVALAQAYTSNAVLFLCSPDDIRNIDPRTTLLVIIEDLGGKYLFDKMEVNKWFGVLDCLLKLVTAGKLQVVLTSETEKLQSCIREIAPHPLFLNRVILTRRQMDMPIKQESSEIDENQCEHSSNDARKSLTQDPRTTTALHTGRGISASLPPYMGSGRLTAKFLTQDPRTTTALHTGRGLSASIIPYMESGYVTANTPPLNLSTTSALHEKRGVWTLVTPFKDNTKKSDFVISLWPFSAPLPF